MAPPFDHEHVIEDGKCALCGAREDVVRASTQPDTKPKYANGRDEPCEICGDGGHTEIACSNIPPIDQELLTAAVKKTVEDYGETLRMLGSVDVANNYVEEER